MVGVGGRGGMRRSGISYIVIDDTHGDGRGEREGEEKCRCVFVVLFSFPLCPLLAVGTAPVLIVGAEGLVDAVVHLRHRVLCSGKR